MEDAVPLKAYCDARFSAIEATATERNATSNQALEVARQELRAWQASHNDLQRQMTEREKQLIGRSEYTTLANQVIRQGNQISMGIGIVLCVQVLIGVALAIYTKH